MSKIADGKRSQGGQKQRWHDVINSDLKSLNLISNWRTKANDRKKWRKELDRLLKNLNHTKEQIEKDCKKTMIIQETLASPVIIIIATKSVSAELV